MIVGRGSIEAREAIGAALAGSGVEIQVRGVVPAEVVADEFARADVLLFVRGAITLQRGSAIAGVACGLPIVGYRVGGSGDALDKAGIEWSPWRDRQSVIRALVRVLSDSALWTELHERSLQAQREHFSWTRIAERFKRRYRNDGTLAQSAHHRVASCSYESPILRLLEQDPRVESEVAYCSLQGVEAAINPDFGVEVKWDVPLLDGYKWTLNTEPFVGAAHRLVLWAVECGIWRKIRRGNFDAVIR